MDVLLVIGNGFVTAGIVCMCLVFWKMRQVFLKSQRCSCGAAGYRSLDGYLWQPSDGQDWIQTDFMSGVPVERQPSVVEVRYNPQDVSDAYVKGMWQKEYRFCETAVCLALLFEQIGFFLVALC